VHGDRVEALAGATVGALNNVLTGHIEGGEVIRIGRCN
jgi:UDP-N-acetylglucosamine 2-epimerase (hydrolysing)